MTDQFSFYIQLPKKADMQYSDDVYWERWEARQEQIAQESLYVVPDSEWSDVWHEFHDEDEDEDDKDEDEDEYEDEYSGYEIAEYRDDDFETAYSLSH